MNKITSKGFTLIELLIVIAIIGILAVILIPNLLAAQKRAYDTTANVCAKSIQTAMAIVKIDTESYASIATVPQLVALDGIGTSCNQSTITITVTTPAAALDYGFSVVDSRGTKTFTVGPFSITKI
jgi:type IV pilus assembly protein PilA